jgi:hypothetical protein
MAAPYPPQGNQSQHTERPLKVYAEQYLEGGALPVGASTEVAPAFPNGEPRVYVPGGVAILRSTDWVISNRYTGAPIEVISDEEKQERFGGPADA